MRSTPTRTTALAGAAALAALTLATGCGGSSNEESSNAAAETSMPADRTVGPGCASVPASGRGSAADIADDPVATAAASNPALSTLVTAVTKAGLVDTLNGAPALTVFAPTNEAFAKIPKATLDKVLADKRALTDLLTYHVVGSRQGPQQLADGTLSTLQGGTIVAMRAGESYRVNDATVVCGNLQTRNATVYVIDSVLMPAAGKPADSPAG